MAIATSTALLGAALIGGGVSALSNRSASKTAAGAAEYAADQNAAVNREIYGQTRADLQPYAQAGQPAVNALLERAGLSPVGQPSAQPQGAAQPQYQAQPQGPTGNDWGGYLQANPDVAAEYQRARSTADPNSPAFQQAGLQSPEAFAQAHYQKYGQAEGRQLPQYAPQPAQAAASAPAKPAGGNAGTSPQEPGTNLMSAARPDAAPAPTFSRPQDQAVPTYQRSAVGNGPSFTFDPSQLDQDLGYQFQRKEMLDGANSGFAARGMLKSGAAAKAILDRSNGLASTSINDIFNRQLGTYNAQRSAYEGDRARTDNIFSQDRTYGTDLWANQQGRADQNFENDRGYGTDAYRYTTNRNDNLFSEDRGYQTGRYDQATSNLFGIAGLGANAAAGTANAGNVFAGNQTANNNMRATNTANAAIAGAANTSNLIGQGLQAYGMYKGGAF